MNTVPRAHTISQAGSSDFRFFDKFQPHWESVGTQEGRVQRVLVVDDDVPTAESLALALSMEGYDARFECSSIEGIASAHSWLPDVIVLDANMPERDGFDTASVIRRIVPSPDLLIIAFSGEYHPDVEQKAYHAGFDAYCQKGHALGELLGTIRLLADSGRF